MATLEFFFDVSSPWTYLAFERVEGIAKRTAAELVWKPFLVGGVFNKVNPSVYQRRENPIPAKDAHYRKSMEDWAAYQGIALGRPSVFPLNSVKALRGAFVAINEGKIADYARGCFKAYWTDDKDISQEAELRAVVEGAGMDWDSFSAAIQTDEIKQIAVHQHRRDHRTRRLRLADGLRQRHRHVFRQRPNGTGRVGAERQESRRYGVGERFPS